MIVPRRRALGGFTLIEVLVVLALVGMLAGSVVGFLWDLWGRRDTLVRDSTDAQAGSAVLERMETDIQCGLAGDQSVGAGVSGTQSSIKLLTRGVDEPVRGQGSTAADLQASEYRFDGGMLKARRWNIGGSVPEFETVCDHVEAARVRYFDGRQWREEFDSLKAGTLPVAIEVALWFGVAKAEGESLPAAATPAVPAGANAGHPENGNEDAEQPGKGASASASLPTRQPDRLRVIVVPDGPVAAWKDSR